MHILLIEPNTLLAQTYAQAFARAGHSVALVRGAQSAIHAADAHAPDVVVLELQLPAHSGIEFLHEFRSYPEWNTVPVVVHTLITPPKLATAKAALARDLGVHQLLYKPQTSLQELLHAVRQVLAESENSSESKRESRDI